jgi:hypothetical protein
VVALRLLTRRATTVCFTWESHMSWSCRPFQARKLPLGLHEGRPEELLDRYREKLEKAFLAGGERAKAELKSQLPSLISDDRNLYCACLHLFRYGGEAPGPDNVRLETSGAQNCLSCAARFATRYAMERIAQVPFAPLSSARAVTEELDPSSSPRCPTASPIGLRSRS